MLYGFNIAKEFGSAIEGCGSVITDGYPTILLKHAIINEQVLSGDLIESNEFGQVWCRNRSFSCKDKYGSHLFICENYEEGYNHKNDMNSLYESMIYPGLFFVETMNNRLVIHASAFSPDDINAVLVVAHGGMGKSTLCAGMKKYQNCEVLTDDFAVISGSGMMLYPGNNEVRLNNDSINALGVQGCEIKQDFAKNRVSMGLNRLVKAEYRIKAIVFLEDGNDLLQTIKISQIECFANILNHIKIKSILKTGYSETILSIISNMANSIAGYKVSFKKEYDLMPIQTTELLKYLFS